jgi:hypothetical protein
LRQKDLHETKFFAKDPAYSALKLDAETLLKGLPKEGEGGTRMGIGMGMIEEMITKTDAMMVTIRSREWTGRRALKGAHMKVWLVALILSIPVLGYSQGPEGFLNFMGFTIGHSRIGDVKRSWGNQGKWDASWRTRVSLSYRIEGNKVVFAASDSTTAAIDDIGIGSDDEDIFSRYPSANVNTLVLPLGLKFGMEQKDFIKFLNGLATKSNGYVGARVDTFDAEEVGFCFVKKLSTCSNHINIRASFNGTIKHGPETLEYIDISYECMDFEKEAEQIEEGKHEP